MNDELRECYRLLELDPGSTVEEVKRSYRHLVKLWHPDRFSPNSPLQQKAEAKLKEINSAYERISKKKAMIETEAAKASRSATGDESEAEAAREPRRAETADQDGAAAGTAEPTSTEATAEADAEREAEATEPSTAAETAGGAAAGVPTAERPATGRGAPRSRRGRRGWPAFGFRPFAQGAVILGVFLLAGALAWTWRRQAAATARSSAPSPLASRVAAGSPAAAAAAAPKERSGASPSAGASPAASAVNPAAGSASGGSLGAGIAAPAPGFGGIKTGAMATGVPNHNRAAIHFSVGSTKAEVLAAQGPPDWATDSVFQYGSTTISFDHDRVASWQEGSSSLNIRLSPPLLAASIGYYTVGSTKNEVIALQGPPDSYTAVTFQYGSSTVTFRNDRVVAWREGTPALKARVMPEVGALVLGYFTVGSSKDEVIALEGPPERSTDSTFQYGSSLVIFQHDRVESWIDGNPALKARLLPLLPPNQLGTFTVGSTKDEVISTQGLPDRSTPTSFQYGSSSVFFRDDRVTAWIAGNPPLKLRAVPGAR